MEASAPAVSEDIPAKSVSPLYTNMINRDGKFSIGIFEVGNPKFCMLSYLCCPFALAYSRTLLDNSDFIYNLFCLPSALVPYRWMVRSSYGIGDYSNFWGDCLTSIFIPCCTVNQILQTTIKKGNPTTDGGSKFNKSPISRPWQGCDCHALFCGLICTPCSIGSSLEESIGIPFFLGCCCLGMCCNVCTARNFIRYHYRLIPYTGCDTCEELLSPAIYCAGCFILGIFFIPYTSFAWPMLWAMSCSVDINLRNEARTKKSGEFKQYLVGYSTALKRDLNIYTVEPSKIEYKSANATIAINDNKIVLNPIDPSTHQSIIKEISGVINNSNNNNERIEKSE